MEATAYAKPPHRVVAPQYKILRSTDPILLEREVNQHLIEGWELSGGLVTSPPTSEFLQSVHTITYYVCKAQDCTHPRE